MNTNTPLRAAHAGFTLVEALVSLLVLSIGMLGIALLYNTSLQAGRSAVTTTQAVTLASDMADRISANPGAGIAYEGPAGTNPTCVGTGAAICTPAQMAANDLSLWQQQLAAALPQGNGAVTFVPGAGAPDQYNIRVGWSEPGVGNQGYVLTVER